MAVQHTTEALKAALEHHRHGRLEKAVGIYESILAADALHADATHLLGVVALQRGDFGRAVELIRRAITLHPLKAPFHSNLAEALRAMGQLEPAAQSCLAALSLDPRYAGAANNLGLVLLAQSKVQEAIAWYRNAIRFDPRFAMACNNLASALLQSGDVPQAIVSFRQALSIDPGFAEAHSDLGQLLLESHQLQEALAHCREAVQLRPDLAGAQNNLGNVLRGMGQLPAAKACYSEALRLNPASAVACNNLGEALQEEGALGEAISWYRRALQLDSRAARFHSNLAAALAEQERYDGALASCEAALKLDPNDAKAHLCIGWVLHERAQFSQAAEEMRQAIRLRPGFVAAHCALGSMLEELGDFKAAEASFREALRLVPDHAGALGQLATLLRNRLPQAEQELMQRLLAESDVLPGKAATLHFGLAQVLDAEGKYAQAAAHLEKGNALRKAGRERQGMSYDPKEHTQLVDGLIAAFSPEFFGRTRAFGLESERLVFIVGLPRSSTTLTEQILASHAQVFGAGELSLLREDFEALPEVLASQAAPVACVGQLTRDSAQKLSRRHLNQLLTLNASAPRVADKMPDNYLYLGLAAVLFPRARFIHCRRDLRDVAVSCWMTNFGQIRWANDFEHIATRFHEYKRIMAYWRKVLPVPMMEVDYEETVADLEGVARKLVSWVGLEWDPACLTFHQISRPVGTASLAQVRQPINTRSVQRWKHYEKELAPLFERLRPLL